MMTVRFALCATRAVPVAFLRYGRRERMNSIQLDQLPERIKNIKVINKVNEDVEVINPTLFSMIGKGRQGAVFTWTPDVCFKIFGNEEDCEREHYALSLGQKTGLFPKVYKK